MGFFDFLKKKEFAKIKEQEQIILQLKEENSSLKAELETYYKFKEVRDIDSYKSSIQADIIVLERERDALNEMRTQLEEDCDSIKRQVAIFEDSLEYASYGIYAPHFSFDTSEKFKNEIVAVREIQKTYIKNGIAISGGETITWNGSLSQGQAMVKREKKLMMRAFNGEADSFISSVDWNNILVMEERLRKSFDAINATYKSQGIAISALYLKLKLDELRLTHEYRAKKQAEREEQRVIREQMREEERALKEMEQAKLKAEKEERMYLQALEKARREMGQAVGEKQAELLAKIAELEAGLVNAETLKQKAISMAQQTKMGYVYVISNIGSFGEDVYKIGMTRRLEPMDRVKELGDASVPFSFDVHALIFSENAPELENALHKEFDTHRVNMVNTKREFFNVKLTDIRDVAERHGAKVDFTMVAEAEEFRETMKIKQARLSHNIAV